MMTKFLLAFSLALTLSAVADTGATDIKALEDSLAANPQNFDLVSRLGMIYLQQENYNSAIALFKRYREYDSTNVEAIYLYARAQDLSDNIFDATAGYLLAIETDSTYWRPYRELAMIYDVFADYENTNKFIVNALRYSPYPESLYYNVGYSFDMLDLPDSALVYYRLAIEADSTDSQAYMNIGAIWGNRGEVDSARYYTEKSIELNPDSPIASFNYAEIMTMVGDTVEAITYFSRAIALKTDLFAANKRLGELFEARGDSSMAKIYFMEFLKLAPIVYADDIDEVKKKLDSYK